MKMDDFTFYAIISFISLLSIYLIRTLLASPGRRLPPSPMPLPVIGHLHLIAPIPHQALHKLSKRHGPLLSLRLGSVPCVVASSAATAKEFLKTHDLTFSDRPQSKAVDYLTYGSADFSFAPYGPYWRFIKKLCMSELLGGRTLDLLHPVRRDERACLLRALYSKSVARGPVNVGSELVKFTNNVICRMTMSRTCSETDGEAEAVRKLVAETAELTGKFNLSDYIGLGKKLDLQGFDKRLEDLRRRFDEMMEGILREKEEGRRKGKETGGGDGDSGRVKDLLDILLDIAEDESAEMKLTRENIKAFILDIFAAGTDTSAITTEWALSELINHPPIMEKLRDEIDAVVGKARVADESDVSNLPYLQCVVKETLRLHPTGPMLVRQSTKDCTVAGYHVPARTTLFVNIWAIGRDPEQWAEPVEFRPERFWGEGNIDVRGQHYHMLPFGSGRRGCPGTSLALMVVQAAVAAMVQCFEWEVEGGVVDMEEGVGLTLPRAKPLVCKPAVRMDGLEEMLGLAYN